MPGTLIPVNWPEEVIYLRDLTYTVSVTADIRAKLCRTPSDKTCSITISPSMVEAPYPWLEIVTIDDPAHLAHGQRGLFATQDLLPDRFICLYLGLVHRNSLSDTNPHSDYDLLLDSNIGLSVDAASAGNESRFANDFRGVAERPNAEFRDCLVHVKRLDGVMTLEKRVGIFVMRTGKAERRKEGIRSGMEILLSYGTEFWEARRTVATMRKDSEMLRIANAALES